MNVGLLLGQTAATQPTDYLGLFFDGGCYAIPLALLGGYIFWSIISYRKGLNQQGKAVGQMDEAVAMQRLSTHREEVRIQLAHQALLMQQEQIRLLKKLAGEPGDPPTVTPLPSLTPAPPTAPNVPPQV